MQLTTKSRYALRALGELAARGPSKAVSRAQLARAQGLSADYMAQLFRSLQAAGLVHSVKGPGGGYILARPAAEITVADIVSAVDGPIVFAPCDGVTESCARADDCVARLVWHDAAAALTRSLSSWSLEDIALRLNAAPRPNSIPDEEQ